MNTRLMPACFPKGRGASCGLLFLANVILGFLLFTAITGCQTEGSNPKFAELPRKKSTPQATNHPAPIHSESLVLREGDTLKITFLGAPTLNTTKLIRRDGKINLELVGEVTAAGMTPGDLEKELKKLYKDQIVVNEITVTLESDSFIVYVTGAVLHAQKVSSNHPMTLLEAIMEAGGPDYSKANLKAVTVLHQVDGGRVEQIILNLKDVINGKSNVQYYLRPGDTIIVREKFAWF